MGVCVRTDRDRGGTGYPGLEFSQHEHHLPHHPLRDLMNKEAIAFPTSLDSLLTLIRGEFVRRFESNFHKTAHGCWLWTGKLTVAGHGLFNVWGRIETRASRFSWLIYVGDIPHGMGVLHRNSCHNPACVNPDHLYLGTPADNARDRSMCVSKIAKLTDEQVRAIRDDCRPNRRIAFEYGIDHSNVSRIKRGKLHKHVK